MQTSIRSFIHHGLCISLALATVCLASGMLLAAPPDGPEAEQTAMLVLRNGQTLRGRILQAGDIYYVVFPDGEIRLKASEVDFACRDIEEAFRIKQAAVQADNAEDHLRLAYWCLRQKLYGHASRKLADAMDVDPTHPAIAVLRRHLLAEMQEPVARETSEPTPSKSPYLPDAELTRFARELPADAVEKFTDTIQPLLVNSCSTAGCHGPASKSEYHLLRPASGGVASRRLTLTNLHATLAWINREEPQTSRLLTAIAEPHGDAQSAVFRAHQQSQYNELAVWAHQISGKMSLRSVGLPAPSSESTTKKPGFFFPEDPQPVSPQKTAVSDADGSSNNATAGSSGNTLADGSGVEPASFESSDSSHPAVASEADKLLPVRPKLQRGAKIKQFVPKDPFDPAIFNRRYHKHQ